jgi:hypothetical protein
MWHMISAQLMAQRALGIWCTRVNLDKRQAANLASSRWHAYARPIVNLLFGACGLVAGEVEKKAARGYSCGSYPIREVVAILL